MVMEKKDLYRLLPKIDELLLKEEMQSYRQNIDDEYIVKILRNVIDDIREKIANDFPEKLIISLISRIHDEVNNRLDELLSGSLKSVINGTGVVIHTNLGRSVVKKEIMEQVTKKLCGYTNLEYDIQQGSRGSRYDLVEKTLCLLTGAESALVVNNNAAAVILILNTLASGGETIVSRGELVEIGGSFRIPEVMKLSGSQLIEVGTTNKTYIKDYKERITESTKVLMKVHTSNYRLVGFTESVTKEELVELCKKENLISVEDLGSGVLIDLTKYGLPYEPTVQESLQSGIDIVSFSGDKLLGGPQAGIILGKKKWIDQMKKNQLTRALRVDKLTLATLEETLKYYFKEEGLLNHVTSLAQITMKVDKVKEKAQWIIDHMVLNQDVDKEIFELVPCLSKVGGGSMPETVLNSWGIQVASPNITAANIEQQLRLGSPPIISRVTDNKVMIDCRTLLDDELMIVAERLAMISKGV